jgi:hypothetical protein
LKYGAIWNPKNGLFMMVNKKPPKIRLSYFWCIFHGHRKYPLFFAVKNVKIRGIIFSGQKKPQKLRDITFDSFSCPWKLKIPYF